MKYFNIKRYKFSTIIVSLSNFLYRNLNFIKHINFNFFFNYFDATKGALKKIVKYLDFRKYNIFDIVKTIKIKNNKFLFFHFPLFIIFFSLLYIIIPTFYAYDKSKVKKAICGGEEVKCVVKGKLSYSFYPTPRLNLKDLIINIPSGKVTLLTAKDVTLKLSVKNLLAKEKHKINSVVFSNFESVINLKKLKSYNGIFNNKIVSIPALFKKGKIVLYDEKDYVATISNVHLDLKSLRDFSEVKMNGEFLNDNIVINYINKTSDNKPETNIDIRMKGINSIIKVSFFNSYKDIKDGKFSIRQNKNNISGIFDYKDNQITIVKSNARNSFIDGKLIGKIILLPYFEFGLDLDLNSINFTKIYNYFLSLDKKRQKELFKINNKINGKLNFSTEKVYSKHNLVKSFESRIKFYNGNVKIEQFLINLGKLGAADLLGKINNDKKSTNFKFESNIFVDNSKKFLSKFGIYNKEKLSANLFVAGNIDLMNPRASFYEITGKEKFNTEDVNFIESEFNDLMFENDFEDLFNFQKFKVFLKSVRDEKN